MRFIGSNDASTLQGVIEELESIRRYHTYRAKTAKRKRQREDAELLVGFLMMLENDFAVYAKNGPLPDLTKLRIVVPEESRQRLIEDGAK